MSGASPTYVSSEKSKSHLVREMFDRIAPRYDFLNGLLSLGMDRRWRRHALRHVIACAPRDVLDLACGTCSMTRGLLRRYPACERIYAVDFSANMLASAMAKSWPAPWRERVEFIQAAAEQLPLREACVQCVMVTFGIRNFGDYRQSLREMHRVLARGGQVVITEFSQPKNRLMRFVYRFYFHRCLPFIGGWISGDRPAYQYLPDSVDAFPEGDQFVEAMQEAGFINVTCHQLTAGIATIYVASRG